MRAFPVLLPLLSACRLGFEPTINDDEPESDASLVLEDSPDDVEESAAPLSWYYPDSDGDGYGSDAGRVEAAAPPEGFIERGGDCDDAEAEVNPGSSRQRDGVDSDCDGRRDWLVKTYIAVDDAFVACIDRETNVISQGSAWAYSVEAHVWLESGEHVIGIQGWDTGRVITAAMAHIEISTGEAWVSDGTWRYDPAPAADPSSRTGWCSPSFDDATWSLVKVIGPRLTPPWSYGPLNMPAGTPAMWIWDHYPVDLNTQYLRKRFVLP